MKISREQIAWTILIVTAVSGGCMIILVAFILVFLQPVGRLLLDLPASRMADYSRDPQVYLLPLRPELEADLREDQALIAWERNGIATRWENPGGEPPQPEGTGSGADMGTFVPDWSTPVGTGSPTPTTSPTPTASHTPTVPATLTQPAVATVFASATSTLPSPPSATATRIVVLPASPTATRTRMPTDTPLPPSASATPRPQATHTAPPPPPPTEAYPPPPYP